MVQLEGLKCQGGADEKKDEVTHIGMFRQQLARSFGHLRKRSSTGNLEASAAGDPSQDGHSSSSSDASNSRAASVQNLADGPLTDSNLATGPNPAATAAKLKVGRPEEARHHKHFACKADCLQRCPCRSAESASLGADTTSVVFGGCPPENGILCGSEDISVRERGRSEAYEGHRSPWLH